MKKTGYIIVFVLFLFIASGCDDATPKITEEQAKSIVIDNHTNTIGEVEVISVTHKNNMYIIEWENKENCENGIDSVDDQDGEVEMVEASIC